MDHCDRREDGQAFDCGGVHVTVSFSSGGKSLQECVVELLTARLPGSGDTE